jgi:hypothetical protein
MFLELANEKKKKKTKTKTLTKPFWTISPKYSKQRRSQVED